MQINSNLIQRIRRNSLHKTSFIFAYMKLCAWFLYREEYFLAFDFHTIFGWNISTEWFDAIW